jgi:hypothetical protein
MAIDSGYWGNGAALDSGYWESGEDTNVRTNADHIRSMTDEELAELFKAFCEASECITPSGAVCPFYSTCPIDQCVGNHLWLNWLKQPYKEATDD